MSKLELLKKKIGKDDVIILNEELLPKKVILNSFGEGIVGRDHRYTPKKVYDIIGISWNIFPDRTRDLAYILVNDDGVLKLESTEHFKIKGENTDD